MARARKNFTAPFSKKFLTNKKHKRKNQNATNDKLKHFFSKVFYSKMIDIKNKNKKVNALISIPFILFFLSLVCLHFTIRV